PTTGSVDSSRRTGRRAALAHAGPPAGPRRPTPGFGEQRRPSRSVRCDARSVGAVQALQDPGADGLQLLGLVVAELVEHQLLHRLDMLGRGLLDRFSAALG